MPKAIISNRIYLDTTPEILAKITKALTYKIKKPPRPGMTVFSQFEIIKNYKLLPKGILSIPGGREDLIPADYEVIDRRINEHYPFPDPKLPLREGHQQLIYNQVDSSCFINAMVGFGKTFLALHIARKLGQKTLVVCHNTMLRDQWIGEVKKLYGMEVGIIGSGDFDIDHSIVIGNIQTLIKELPKINKEFGTVITDECLDYSSQVITLENGKQRIGVIVNNKLPVHVLSLDPATGISSYKKVVTYYKSPHTECLKITHSGGGNFKCTGNHNVYTYDRGIIEKVTADTLEVGDLLIETTSTHKSTQIINEEWKDIALGLILGDGNLGYPHSKSDSVRIRITHGERQFGYLNWKASIIGDTTEVLGKSGYSDNNIKSISSKSFYDVDNWYEQLYVDGHKRKITKKIADTMSIRSWALLFQDDGSASQTADCLTFSVCELDELSVSFLQDSLSKLFNIQDSKQYLCSRGYRYLRLNKDATVKFLDGINGLVHPDLYYKLHSISGRIKEFSFTLPSTPMFNKDYAIRRITSIETSTLTGGHKFNIEVEDNHTYFANGILVANCHHITATTFTQFLDGMYATYKIGLSGTMVRKDGRHILFKDFFGPVLFQPPGENTLTPTIKIIKTGVALSEGDPWAIKINNLLYDVDYQELIAVIASKEISKGHKVLIVADRVEFLKSVGELIGESCVCITGSSTLEERLAVTKQLESGEKNCVAGSRQIVSEGWSVNILSCVILAAPIANDSLLEQIIGRVMRNHPDKLDPLVIDLNFSGPSDRKQNLLRKNFYLRKGWDIE